jgi:hypothetical protein
MKSTLRCSTPSTAHPSGSSPGSQNLAWQSKHSSSDDGSVIDYKVESVVSELISPEDVSGYWQIEHTRFEAGIVSSVERVLARLPHVFGARLSHRVRPIEPVTK